MLNHITIMGRLTRDPELRRTGSGIAVASFTVAVDRDYSGKDSKEKETDFIDCVAWRQTGEFVSKFFTKGRMIVVSGRLQIRDWTDKEGNKRRTAEVVADNCYFGDSKRDGNGNGNNNGNYGGNQAQYGNNYSGNGGGHPGTADPGYNGAAYGAPNAYGAPGGNPAYGGGNYYGGAPAPNYSGYNAPTNPASEFAMLEDDDAQLPF